LKGSKLKIKTILLLGIVLFLSSASFSMAIDNSEPITQPMLPMVQAMGGAYTAVAGDESTVFYNPAGYAVIQDPILSVSVCDININVDESAIDVYKAILKRENLSKAENINKYLEDTTVSCGLSGPIYFGRVGNNFGFAFYDNAQMLFDSTPGALQPYADYYTFTDLGFTGGFGFKIVDDLYTGFNFKVVLRLKSELHGTVTEVFDTIEDDSIPVAKSAGFGGDIGLLYRPFSWFSLGLNARDFFGTRFTTWDDILGSQNYPSSMIKPRLALGLAFFPMRTEQDPTSKKDITIALDYWDLLDWSSPLTNIKFGVMIRPFGFLDLRGGIDAGYLTGGVAFHVKIFHFSIAYYVKELGAYPGSKPLQNLTFESAFKW